MAYITKLPFEGVFKVTYPYGVKDSNYRSGYHQGIDMGNSQKPEVYSINTGVVSYAGWENANNKSQGFGLYISVKFDVTPTGYKKVFYGHLNEIRVKVGQQVSNPTIIGVMGSTGFSTGPHTHVEIREYDNNNNVIKILNPATYMGIPNAVGTYDSASYRIELGNNSKYTTGRYKVTAREGLNVRSGPGTQNGKISNARFPNGAYPHGQVFDVFEVKDNWGRTPSGWVSLDYSAKM